jgi:ammonium transporter, Amt family
MSAKLVPLSLLVLVAIAGVVVPNVAQTSVGGPVNGGDVAWMLTASALVLLMTPGLSYFYGGMVRPHNVVSTMLQSFIAMGVISIVWVVAGFSLAFGDSIGGIIGNPLTYFMLRGVGTQTHPTLAPTIPLLLFAFFQLKFAIITPALITGSFAERVRFSGYLLFIILFTIFIYSPLAHMTWHPDGFLRKLGVLDYAGGTVVHMSAGLAALVGALYLGRREIHVARKSHTPANIPYVILGTGLLWFGWFGFNAGSALSASDGAALAFATTNTASAAAALAWVFLDLVRGRRISALGACVGAVVGLVAITPAAGFVPVAASIAIGTIASMGSYFAVHLKTRTNIDDTLDVFPCHGIGGIIGTLLTGVFARDVGLLTGATATMIAQLIAVVVVTTFVLVGSYILYRITDLIIPLRVSKDQEYQGLDFTQHGESAISFADAAMFTAESGVTLTPKTH